MSNIDSAPLKDTPTTPPSNEKSVPQSPYPQEDVEDRENVSTVRPEDYPEQQ